MADSRVTQSATLVLNQGDANARITQTAILALTALPPHAWVTQVARLKLIAEMAGSLVTQSAVLALGTWTPCLQTWCQVWEITRMDGAIFRFTTHDTPVTFRGNEYSPCDGLSASAIDSSMVSTSSGGGDVQAFGILTDDAISEADVADGLFDGALFEVWQVNWSDQTDIPKRVVKGIMSKATLDKSSYTATILTPTARLGQQPLLDTYSPGCRWELGDSRCKVNIAAFQVSGSVTGISGINAVTQLHRRRFKDDSRTEADGKFDLGTLTWTSGPNTGRSSEVKTFVDGVITLWSPMPLPIQPGDEYTMVPGCDKTKNTCKIKYANYINYGGFPDLPGLDSILETPDAKAS